MTDKIPVVVVAGPTASGKTSLAIDIAKHFDGEIVSADSMQIYKYMDIGTAKPTSAERAECVHHLIDFIEPDYDYSVAEYVEDAHEVIADIHRRGKLPVICGGTGLYINSLINDIAFGEPDCDQALRDELRELAEEKGGEYLIDMLREFDSVSADRLHPNNLKRVIRAIEFYKLSGKPISEHQEETKRTESRYRPIMFLIDRDRAELYDRINRRVDMMIEDGLLAEVKRLMDMGYTKSLNSMKGIGYKEIMDYYNGEYSLDEAIEAVKHGSRRYAKRQLTWFRRDERIIMLKPETASETAIEMIKKSLS